VNKKLTENKQFFLSKLSVGVDAYVSELSEGRSFRSKVSGLGLNVGTKLRVEKTTSSANGCMIIAIGDSRLIIGHGIAEKIIVSIY
jgi:ferrous iron transport protein A